MSHTPGPWSLERDYNGVPEFVFGGDTCVCDFGIEAPKPEDACLIAAAPELCEALENLIEFLVHGKKNCQAILRAKAALARARGDEGEDNA